MTEQDTVQVEVEAEHEAPEAQPEAAPETAPEAPPAKAKAKPRAKKVVVIDALPAEQAPEPPELVREPVKRKPRAKAKAAPGIPDATPEPKAKSRAKKVQLHEVKAEVDPEPPYVSQAAITHDDLHGMFRAYLGNHKVLTQQTKREMYRNWIAA